MKRIFTFVSTFVVIALLAACSGSNLEDALESVTLPSSVTEDITLPTVGKEFSDVTVSFDSMNDDVLTDDLKVHRQNVDVTVEVKVTVTKGEESADKTVSVIVEKLSNQDLLTLALDGFVLPASVTNNIDFIALEDSSPILDDVMYAITSSHPEVISNSGVVNQALEDQDVSLTVTVRVGDDTDSKTVNVLVPKREKTDEEVVSDAQASFTLPFTEVLNSVLLSDSYEGTSLTYTSNNQDLFANDGTVVRPFITDESISLTVTFTKGEATSTKSFDVLVKGLPVEEIPVVMDASYTLTSSSDDMNMDAVFTLSGSLAFMSSEVEKTVELVLYWQDDTVLDTITTTTVDGDFSVSVAVNEYTIGWDWYKFKVNVIEGDYRKDNVMIPFDETSKIIAVLEGADGDVRYFETVDNAGYVNVSMSGVEAENKTEVAKVLADYNRLSLPQTEFINRFDFPLTTGEWGHGSTISWQIEDNTYASVTDNSLLVMASSPSDETLTVTATLTNGAQTVTKSFEVSVIKAEVSFTNNLAVWEEVKNEANLDLSTILTGDIVNDNDLTVSLELEVYITLEGVDTVLGSYANLSEDASSYRFDVAISELDFQGEWGKFRIKATVEGDDILYAFADDSVTLPSSIGSSYQEDTASYFALGNQWGMLYIQPSSVAASNASTDNLSLSVENDRVFLNIAGSLDVDAVITLQIKNDSNVYTNEATIDREYLFKVDITDLAADGDWRDIHIHFSQTIDGVVIDGFSDIYAPWDVKDALNTNYSTSVNGKTYSFAEWASNLKVVVAVEE